MDVERIADEACHCGEGPTWHAAEQRLYWLDNVTGRLFSFDPVAHRHGLVIQAEGIAAMSVQTDGSMLIYGQACGVRRWRDGELTPFYEPMPGESRFNDVAADPEGRVFAGSMPVNDPDNKRPGRLYRFDIDGSCRVVEEGLGCANGIGFSLDSKTMYHVDSPTHAIYAYDYDRPTGGLTNRRVFARVEKSMFPDGLTVDAEGCVWSAMWEGGRVIRFSPEGEPMKTVRFPTPLITSVMFGGSGLDELYVTSAGGDDKAKRGPDAGALFRVIPGVKGRPENLSRLGL